MAVIIEVHPHPAGEQLKSLAANTLVAGLDQLNPLVAAVPVEIAVVPRTSSVSNPVATANLGC